MSGNTGAYDIIVIGGGHAGIEAALVSARMGKRTAIVTMDRNAIGRMSCNPAIGGLAKGHLVREIDAMGGQMAKIIDATGIQFRMLNRSKGPAVWSPRAQADRKLYAREALHVIEQQEKLTIFEGMVVRLITVKGKLAAIQLKNGDCLETRAVVVTTGTFMNGLIHIGLKSFPAGRIDEPPSTGLSESLLEYGHTSARFKTGTPPRIDGRSVDLDHTIVQEGDNPPIPFSYQTESIQREQVPCYLTYTNETSHAILKSGLDRSPLYTGIITSSGPRYCPSVETKVVRFPDKVRHQIFLEPEGLDTSEMYVNGFSTSLPEDVQDSALRTVKGLEHVEITRFGYAIEYDFFPPTEIKPTMESRFIHGVFLAGQICGTSGYEEAAGQGLIAGINAVLLLDGKPPFLLERSEAYIGVMIDDLVTKGIDEPYRMFTSRAEYRLLLRQDNADERLMKYGRQLGLVSEESFQEIDYRRNMVKELIEKAKSRWVHPDEINPFLASTGSTLLSKVDSLYQVMKRPEVNVDSVAALINGMIPEKLEDIEKILPKMEMETRYEGYVRRQMEQVEKFQKLESVLLPADINYDELNSLKAEVVERLNNHRPLSIGQASRIPGITPAAISTLLIHMKKHGWV